ncbi:MAG: kelch repeat-containing protein [Candidatus Eisenbacteria bacterium]
MPASSPDPAVCRALRAAAFRLTAALLLAAAPAAFADTAFTRCDPFMLRMPETALQSPVHELPSASGDTSFVIGPLPTRPTDGPGTSGPSAEWRMIGPYDLGSATSNLVVDTPRDRLVLFGGYSFITGRNLVWTRPLSDDHALWTRIEVAGPYPGRYTAPTSVYDAARQRLIVLGGHPGDGVWALTLAGEPAWTLLSPANPGTSGDMNGTVAIYDPVGDRAVVFRGQSEVWAFPLGEPSGWTQLTPTGTPPTPRDNYHAVYDPNRHRMLLFSGYGVSDGDLWSLSLGDAPAWEPITTGGEPVPSLYQGAAAYDPVHDRMVVSNGIRLDARCCATPETWILQFGDVPTWRRFLPEVRPLARNGPCMTYDAVRDRFVMFGGGVSDTWSLAIGTDTTWTVVQPDLSGPFRLYGAALVHDARRGRLLRFGGHNHFIIHGTVFSYESNELWEIGTQPYELWTLVRAGTLPGMAGMSVLVDPGADRLVTLGGYSLQTLEWGSTWSLSLDPADTTGWQPLTVAGDVPPARTMQAAAADPVARRIAVFGGRTPTGALGDSWLLDLHEPATWTRLDSTQASPPPRYGHGMVYDSVGERMLLFGGRDDAGHTYGDLWQLSLTGTPAWSPVDLPPGPGPRSHGALVYDSLRQRLVLFGGRDSNGVALRDTWYLPLAPRTAWVLADSFAALPTERWYAEAVFDASNDRMVVISGTQEPCSSDAEFVFDDWEMHSTDRILKPLVLNSLERHPQSVTLEWRADAFATFAGTVERRTESSPWQPMGPVELGVDQSVRFVDTTVRPGTRYAYRVHWSEQTSANTSEPVWTDVPALHLALDRIPNPLVGDLEVSFSLPDARASALDLLDVSGRVVATRELGGLGAGDHRLALATRGSLKPGRYWVRLRTGEGSRSTGVIVLR